MPFTKRIAPARVLDTAVQMVEQHYPLGISLRALASALGVKAPSLYRYFPQKEALEIAVAEQACRVLLTGLEGAAGIPAPEARFRATAEAYLRFAREHFPLYSFIADRIPQTYGLPASKAVWNSLLHAASGVSGTPDDTAAAVAMWSFLHGYALLEHSGAFGASGPKGGLERGLVAFLAQFPQGTTAAAKPRASSATAARRRRADSGADR